MKRLLFGLLVVFVLFTGCSRRMGDLTVMSTRNVHFNSGNELVQRDVKGKSYVYSILTFGLGNINLEEAVEQALRKSEADYLTNVVIYDVNVSFILFGWNGIKIRADAWRNGDMGLDTVPDDAIYSYSEITLIRDDEINGYRVVLLTKNN